MERSFKKEVEALKLGSGETFRGEGILAVTKALLQSGVSYVGGYQGAPVSHLLDVMVEAEDAALLPCLTTGTPQAATTIADIVEMFTVPRPSPPVPHVSTTACPSRAATSSPTAASAPPTGRAAPSGRTRCTSSTACANPPGCGAG